METQLAAEIASEILALSSHYPAKRLAPDAKARWLADYADDLSGAGWSAQDVRLACAMWRSSDSRKMPSPGELLAKGRTAISSKTRDTSPKLPPPPRFSEEHCAEMRGKIAGLVGDLLAGQKDYRRLLGESEAEYAERLWPGRRIDRVRGAAGVF